MEGLKVSEANLVVYIHPSKADKVPESILRELSSLLFKYNEIFDGVVLAYDVTIQGDNARILSGVHPHFGVTLKSELLLFSPKPAMLLEGKVVKLAKESIHLIVLGFASAVIIEEDIREEFKYKTKHGEGVYISTHHKRHVIKVGTVISFSVKSFDEEILHIDGSLIPSDTGSMHYQLEKISNEYSVERKSKKKHRQTEIRDVEEDAKVGADEGVASLNSDHGVKKKKSKKQRLDEES